MIKDDDIDVKKFIPPDPLLDISDIPLVTINIPKSAMSKPLSKSKLKVVTPKKN